MSNGGKNVSEAVVEKKGVSAVDFFCIGFGAIVGVGWAVSINGWMTSCGGPIPAALGYLAALILMIPVALCYCELVPMLPVAGGGMAFTFLKAEGYNIGTSLLDQDNIDFCTKEIKDISSTMDKIETQKILNDKEIASIELKKYIN